jgi:protein O-mannosyl-transferase
MNKRLMGPGPIVMLTVFVFAPVLWHNFVNFDDPIYVLDNPIVADGFTWSGVVRAFTMIQAGYWIPLTWLSHMVDIQLFGFAAGLHHFINVVLHILTTLMLYGLVVRMTGERGRAAFVAAIFAIHPLRVESVAWVAERKDVLSTFFWMLAVFAYVEYVARPSRDRYLALAALFVLGLLAKPMVLTLPLALLLLDIWPLRRLSVGLPLRGADWARRADWSPSPPTHADLGTNPRYVHADLGTNPRYVHADLGTNPRYVLLEKIPLLVLSVVAGIVTIWAQQAGGAVKSFELFPLSQRVANALVSYVAYLGMMVWPVNLAVFYPHAPVPVWQVVGAVAVLAAITWFVLRELPRYPYLAVGWFWYLLTLFPVIGLIQAGLQARADRFTYIPHIGLSLAVAWGVPDLLRRRRIRAALPAVTAVVILVFALTARAYVTTWEDDQTLWRRALSVTTDNYMAHHNLGVALAATGQDDAARAEVQEALRIWPEFAEAHNTMGNIEARARDDDKAIGQYLEALRLAPYFSAAHNNLGLALMRREDVAGALAHFETALRLAPDSAASHHNFGRATFALGRLAEAESHYREAIRLRPRYAEAHYSLGELLASSGRMDEAAAEFRVVLKLAPAHTLARVALGRLSGTHD